jgi:hypothetical protein
VAGVNGIKTLQKYTVVCQDVAQQVDQSAGRTLRDRTTYGRR